MNREVEWTPEVVDRLVELVANENNLSYRFIAMLMTKEFNRKFTRNGVSGKVWRMRLPPRPPKPPPVRIHQDEPRFVPPPVLPPPRPQIKPRRNGREVGLLELHNGECKWPSGEKVPYLFCGKPAVLDGGPYCIGHTEIAFVKPKKNWE